MKMENNDVVIKKLEASIQAQKSLLTYLRGFKISRDDVFSTITATQKTQAAAKVMTLGGKAVIIWDSAKEAFTATEIIGG